MPADTACKVQTSAKLEQCYATRRRVQRLIASQLQVLWYYNRIQSDIEYWSRFEVEVAMFYTDRLMVRAIDSESDKATLLQWFNVGVFYTP